MSRARTLSKLFNTDGNLNLSPVESINGNAPFGRKNLIINGDQRIAQRGTDINGISGDGDYIADRFRTRDYGGAGTYNYDQVTDTVPDGFKYASKLTVASAATDVGTYGYSIEQIIEGYNIQQIRLGRSDAKAFTVSFWARSSVAGTYSSGVRTDSGDISFVTEFTLAADTWKYISYTVPAYTTSVPTNLNETNGVGLMLTVAGLASQTAKETSTLDAWQSGNEVWSSNQTNWMGTSGNTFHFTGVQIEVGDQATDFEFVNYTEELAKCQRYFQYFPSGAMGRWNSSAAVEVGTSFPVPMRAKATLDINPNDNTVYIFRVGITVSTATISNSSSIYSSDTGSILALTTSNTSTPNAGEMAVYDTDGTKNAIWCDAEF